MKIPKDIFSSEHFSDVQRAFKVRILFLEAILYSHRHAYVGYRYIMPITQMMKFVFIILCARHSAKYSRLTVSSVFCITSF